MSLIFKKIYDFYDNIPQNFQRFMRRSLNIPDIEDGTKIEAFPKKFDVRGRVIEGKLDGNDVILKYSKYLSLPNSPSSFAYSDNYTDAMRFYSFMDAVKEKLRKLAKKKGDHSFSEEKDQQCQYALLQGLKNIVPIIGVTKVHYPNVHEENIAEILPKVPGHTLLDCIINKFPPYDTPLGLPRNEFIATDLLLQLANVRFLLHTCGYVYGDLHKGNIMITSNDLSFVIKLIDWDRLTKIKHQADTDNDRCYFKDVLFPILLGQQCLNSKGLDHPIVPKEDSDRTQIKDFFRKYRRRFKSTNLYAPETLNALMKILKNIFLPNNDEKKLTMENIVARLRALRNDLKASYRDGEREEMADELEMTEDEEQSVSASVRSEDCKSEERDDETQNAQ
ncbi:MAG: hypothetical protein LBB11_01465 [Puniceicoccales bacterium]|nr:hypothetical protein [Puniceicoccales bacterium]